jgi:hypothetical protein
VNWKDSNYRPGYSEEEGGPREPPKKVATLILDSEGLFGPEKNAFNKGFALFMRLISVSDVIVVNFHGQINKHHVRTLEKASMLFMNDFNDVDIHHKPYLIVFCQRTNRPINLQSFKDNFLTKDLSAFARTNVINSHDQVDPDENKIRLATTDLKETILHYLSDNDYQTPEKVWDRLKRFESSEMSIDIPDDVLDNNKYKCSAACVKCNRNCTKSTIRIHEHFRREDDCPLQANSKKYCPACLEKKNHFSELTASVDKLSFIGRGKRYDCATHGTIGYGRRLFIFQNKNMKVTTRAEHEFEQKKKAPK